MAYAKTLELAQLLHLCGVMEKDSRAEICNALLARIRLPDDWEDEPADEPSAITGRGATRGVRKVSQWRQLMDGGIVPVLINVLQTEQSGSKARHVAANCIFALALRSDLRHRVMLSRTCTTSMLTLIQGKNRERDDSATAKHVLSYLNAICDGNRENQIHTRELGGFKPLGRLLHHAIHVSDIRLGNSICRLCESLASPKENRWLLVKSLVAPGLALIVKTVPSANIKSNSETLLRSNTFFGRKGATDDLLREWLESQDGMNARIAAASTLAMISDVGATVDKNDDMNSTANVNTPRCDLVAMGLVPALLSALDATDAREMRQRQSRQDVGFIRRGGDADIKSTDAYSEYEMNIYELCLEALCHLTAVAHIRPQDFKAAIPYLVEGLLTINVSAGAMPTNEFVPPLLVALSSAFFRVSRAPALRKVFLDAGGVQSAHRVAAGLALDNAEAGQCRLLLLRTLSNLALDRDGNRPSIDIQMRLVRGGVLEWIAHETKRFELIAADANDILAQCRMISTALEAQADPLVPDFERDQLLRPGAMNASIDRYGGGGDGAGIPEELLHMTKNCTTSANHRSFEEDRRISSPSSRMNDAAFTQVLVSLRHGVRVVLHSQTESSPRRMQLSNDGKAICFSAIPPSAVRLAASAGEGNDYDSIHDEDSEGNHGSSILEYFPVANITRVRRGHPLRIAGQVPTLSRFSRHFRIELDPSTSNVVGGFQGKALSAESFLTLSSGDDEDFSIQCRPTSFLIEARTVESCHLLADGLERIAQLFCSDESWKYWQGVARLISPSNVPIEKNLKNKIGFEGESPPR